MLNGLDLFSGIGGISWGLRDYIQPSAYCEKDTYCQGVLLSRMARGFIRPAPIWDDVSTLKGREFLLSTDIIYGGFPCQGISVAGHGAGLADERSGLFWEIVRLAKEIKPKFIFLENVPAITSRGGGTVVCALTEMGYDSRWCVISAASLGAPHKRDRWFLLAHSQHSRWNSSSLTGSTEESVRDAQEGENTTEQSEGMDTSRDVATKLTSHSSSLRCNQGTSKTLRSPRETEQHEEHGTDSSPLLSYWQETEPPLCGVDDGIPYRVDRIRGLGNAVVPQQAKEAFKLLMGLSPAPKEETP